MRMSTRNNTSVGTGRRIDQLEVLKLMGKWLGEDLWSS